MAKSTPPDKPTGKTAARGLGRGLASLLQEPVKLTSLTAPQASSSVQALGIDEIQASALQPRQQFDEPSLDELAASIRQQGVLQPLLVRPLDDAPAGPGYELVAGERRWRAAQRAGLHRVPVVVRRLGAKEVLEIALIENIQRRDLNAMEESLAYYRLMEEFGYTQEQLGAQLGKSRAYIANMVRLRSLPARVQQWVRDGKLAAGAARTLIGRDDAAALARRAIAQGLNVRQMEALTAQKGKTRKAAKPSAAADIQALERELSEKLGLSVRVLPRSRQAGQIQIRYASLAQLDGLLRLLRARPPAARR